MYQYFRCFVVSFVVNGGCTGIEIIIDANGREWEKEKKIRELLLWLFGLFVYFFFIPEKNDKWFGLQIAGEIGNFHIDLLYNAITCCNIVKTGLKSPSNQLNYNRFTFYVIGAWGSMLISLIFRFPEFRSIQLNSVRCCWNDWNSRSKYKIFYEYFLVILNLCTIITAPAIMSLNIGFLSWQCKLMENHVKYHEVLSI